MVPPFFEGESPPLVPLSATAMAPLLQSAVTYQNDNKAVETAKETVQDGVEKMKSKVKKAAE